MNSCALCERSAAREYRNESEMSVAVIVLTDSTSYIPANLRDELGIRVVSLQLTFGDEQMRELDITNDEFYPLMERKGIPASSQPTVGEMVEEMQRVVGAGDELCCVFISGDMSGTIANASLARDTVLRKYPQAHIAIVDSRSNSMQLGFAALAAARAARAGATLEQVVAAAEENIHRSRFVFIPRTLEHLVKGGRIGKASALLADLLKIIPVLTVENGFTSVLTKVRTRRNAIAAMVEQVVKDAGAHGLGEVVIHHINCLPDAHELAGLVKARLNAAVSIVDIGPVVGMHVGPGAIGIAYYTQGALR